MATIKKFRDLRSTRYVNVGEVVSVNYPKHGNRNVLTKHSGEVVAVGTGPGGRYITIKGEDICRAPAGALQISF